MLKIKSILIENSGPIERLEVKFNSNEAGFPKPVLLVGENGSGKTTALSFIADSLLQLAATQFKDVLSRNEGGEGTLYFRIRSHDLRIGASTSLAHIRYELNGRNIDYVDRIGENMDENKLRTQLGLDANFPLDTKSIIDKSWSRDLTDLKPTFIKGAYVFFPSGRREVPHWLLTQALHKERYTSAQRFSESVNKPLMVETAAQDTATWIMDALLDAAIGYSPVSGIAVANRILQVILEDHAAHFAVAPRNTWPRVQIYSGIKDHPQNPRRIIIPSLSHLSAGQSMLLSMFGTIANHGTMHQSIGTQEIEGIAIIDEAEVYLHTHLQRSVLPTLIKLFPKVQFIITTHSPSFLMGMKDQFGRDGFQIIDMPSGAAIDVDQFSEVGAAVEALRQTEAFRNEVRAEVARENTQPILIVEGRSDAVLIDGLWQSAMNSSPPFKILIAKGRRALRYLLEDEEFINEVGEGQKVLGIFDFDEAFDDWNGCHKVYPICNGDSETGLLRKHPTKQISVAVLPVPQDRHKQAGERFGAKSTFTIELYVPNEILEQRNHLATDIFPGDVKVYKFQGDKVAFATGAAKEKELLPYFEPLLALIKRELGLASSDSEKIVK